MTLGIGADPGPNAPTNFLLSPQFQQLNICRLKVIFNSLNGVVSC